VRGDKRGSSFLPQFHKPAYYFMECHFVKAGYGEDPDDSLGRDRAGRQRRLDESGDVTLEKFRPCATAHYWTVSAVESASKPSDDGWKSPFCNCGDPAGFTVYG
jgi:hypothetical protein